MDAIKAIDNIRDRLIDHADALSELMKDPEFAKECRRQSVYTKLAIEIYKARKRAGLGQMDLADAVSTTMTKIQKLESGDIPTVALSRIVDIAEFLGCEVEVSFKPIEKFNAKP